MNIPFLIWCAVFLGAVLFELMSPGLFYFLSFALGALAGSMAAFFDVDIAIQLSWFIVVTLISLVMLRRCVSIVQPNAYVSSIDTLIGKQGFVLQDISQFCNGAVKVNGQVWTARSVDNIFIPQGALCQIVSVSGAIITVKKV